LERCGSHHAKAAQQRQAVEKGLGHALQFGLTAPMVLSTALAWLWIVHLGGYSTLFGVASLLIAASS
jgi:hypothetical protein